MVNVSLVEAILREQDDPGSSTTRKIRDLYNIRSGEEPILQHTDIDKEFQIILLKALEAFPDNDDDEPISYTVKLKDSDDGSTPTMKRRSIIKLPKESNDESESDEISSDSEKISTASSITITKPFSPLFLNNMKKFGVSTDWLAKRSNSLRQASYSRSSVKSNTSKLDEMIKSASAKPIRSNRKLSFVEPTTPTKVETDKENTDPTEEPKEMEKTTTYDLSSEIDEDADLSPRSKEFSLRIPRINLPEEETNQLNSSTSSSNDESKTKKKRKTKKLTKKSSPKKTTDEKKKSLPKKTSKTTDEKKKSNEEATDEEKEPNEEITDEKKKPNEETSDEEKTSSPKRNEETTDEKKKSPEKKNKAQGRIEHLKKLLRISGIKVIMKKTELDHFSSNKAKIDYLKSLFDTAGFTGSLSIKDCEKFRKKRDTEKELLEIQASAVDVKGHVKGGRTLRGQGRDADEPEIITKRKRTASTEIEDNDNSSDDDDDDSHKKPIIKKRRVLKMEASPEVSEEEE